MSGEVYLNSGGFIPLICFILGMRGRGHSRQISSPRLLQTPTSVSLQAKCGSVERENAIGSAPGNGSERRLLLVQGDECSQRSQNKTTASAGRRTVCGTDWKQTSLHCNNSCNFRSVSRSDLAGVTVVQYEKTWLKVCFTKDFFFLSNTWYYLTAPE